MKQHPRFCVEVWDASPAEGLDLTSTSFADLGVRVSLDLEEALGDVESIEKQSFFQHEPQL